MQPLIPGISPTWTIGDARQAICHSAQQLFGRAISFEERAFQALEVTTRGGRSANAVHVWSQLAGSFPAISDFYESLGVQFTKVPWPQQPTPLDPNVHVLSELDWTRTLRSVFMRGDSLTSAGELVARKGFVAVRDLAVSLLESSRQGSLISKANDRRTNLVVRAIARGAGIDEATWWSEKLERFASKATNTFDKLYANDPSCGAQQFLLYHDGKRVRLEPFGLFGAYQLQEEPLPDGSLWIARGNVIQPSTRFTSQAIGELEELINGGAKEIEFQHFFEKKPEFLLALGDYVNLHPQLILSRDDGGSLIPDFFLEKMDSSICDICDLKRPTAELVRYQKNRHRFRDTVMEAVSQLTTYKDWFEDRQNRNVFYQRYGLRAYRPRVVVVIGRRRSFEDDIERLSLESQLPGWVTLKTYDDVVSGARRWRRILQDG